MFSISRNARGFTMVELAVTLTILGVALALSIPPFQRSLARSRVDRVPAELQSDLRMAISNAKATGRTIRVVFDTDGYEVMDAADSTSITDRDFDGAAAIASTANPLIFPWGLVQPADVSITSAHYSKNLQILPTGRVEEQ